MRILAILIGACILTARAVWALLVFAADLLVPRFLTEDVALVFTPDGPDVACSMINIAPGETFDAIVTLRSFTWLGVCMFPRQIGAVRPWVNPHD